MTDSTRPNSGDQSSAAQIPEVAAEGWFGPQGSKRYHYFGPDLRALCGKWGLLMHPQNVGLGWDTSIGYTADGDCAECKRRLAKRQEAKANG